ncbi:MAG: LptF/LptG family permease [Phycisphaerae bacterium]|nr:LptF/LptG family permease [Phycisphaerae bacterium]
MVFTIHRYIFRELIRVFIMATIALTFMLSLGSMLQPIQEFGVSPQQAIHLLGYFLPITLTVVLPMSALFSAALIYGRFASDNELAACKASGISLMTLVYPGLCLAVVVAITNLILSFYVVPAFVMRAEKSVQGNAKQIVFRNIQRKGYFEMPGKRFRIYADHVVPKDDMLYGVIMLESKNDDITRQIFAKSARIIIKTESDYTEVTAIAEDTYQLDKNDNPAYSDMIPTMTRFPPMLGDEIKFQKIDRLKEIRADMSKYGPVRKKVLAARAQLATEALAEDIAKKLADPDVGAYHLTSEDKILVVSAAGCKSLGDNTITLAPPIELLEYNKFSRKLSFTWTSDNEAELTFISDQPDSKLGLTLNNTFWKKTDDYKGRAPLLSKVFPGIYLTPEISNKLNKRNRSLIETIATIDNPDAEYPILTAKPSPTLIKLKKDADYSIWITSKKILAEVHTRLVFGIGSITLILFAVALGIIFKGGHLLSAFGASSIPAAALIVFIMSGKELTKTVNKSMPEITGIIVMWSGLALLSIIAFIIFRKLTRT